MKIKISILLSLVFALQIQDSHCQSETNSIKIEKPKDNITTTTTYPQNYTKQEKKKNSYLRNKKRKRKKCEHP